MRFEQICWELAKRIAVKREHWVGVELEMVRGVLMVRDTVRGGVAEWLPTEADLTAEDWTEVGHG